MIAMEVDVEVEASSPTPSRKRPHLAVFSIDCESQQVQTCKHFTVEEEETFAVSSLELWKVRFDYFV
jgi:hypothetical protein